MRRLTADAVEIRRAQLKAQLPGQGGQMQKRVGGTSQRRTEAHRVLQASLGYQTAGAQVFFNKAHDLQAALLGLTLFKAAHSMGRGAAGQGEAQHLGHAGHGVGRTHHGAGAGSGADITDHLRNERMTQAQRDLAIRLSGIDDFTEIMSIYLQAIFNATEFDCGGVYVRDEETGVFEHVYHQGLSEEFANKYNHVPPDAPNAKLLIDGISIYTDYENIKLEHTDAGKQEGIKAIAVIPLADKGNTIGGVTLASHETNTISEYSKRMVDTLSEQIGQVLTRSRLSKALKENAAKYQSLFNNQDLI